MSIDGQLSGWTLLHLDERQQRAQHQTWDVAWERKEQARPGKVSKLGAECNGTSLHFSKPQATQQPNTASTLAKNTLGRVINRFQMFTPPPNGDGSRARSMFRGMKATVIDN